MTPLAKMTPTEITQTFAELESHATSDLRDEGFPLERIAVERALDMRYAGQGYEITLSCEDVTDAASIARLRARFDGLHKQMFGHTAPEEPVEIVSYRLRGIGRVPEVEIPKFAPEGRTLKDALRETRQARFGGAMIPCPVYQRERLDVGIAFEGPAIVDQLDATTVIPIGHKARVDEFKNILIETGSPR
jgi:N-methylhydantoinase A